MLDDGSVIIELSAATQTLKGSATNLETVQESKLYKGFFAFKGGDSTVTAMQQLAADLNATNNETPVIVEPPDPSDISKVDDIGNQNGNAI
jgi:hypothetical protein